ncbi:3'(2'),5'-bisphosphate nucleotidase CysQ [Polymorphobacter multimanifer]|uniref:3'(2'), 5'-bisphosphate nucleotidase n=1 Tax=Polymorphobacter multimanifer TaxID=1070431 RepID=A0A841LFS8_9SPHN|nr:3'(2'),5'-bisphosphate nucleotidase CysQ [Polymorphobacter multimanifer]MBB6227818.1 3'(2'), 5'-bisphosphate nucleotidase [Polymorphobacter multimanifer]GGI78716.1 3'(2'),5'-bisphosphate nucleotidase CysQ [Polymorphobacter multimanifer]
MTMFADDVRLARSLAIAAGNLLLALRRDQRLQGEALGKAGDRQANTLILDALRAARPDDAILSEESVDHPARLAARRVWIIDPVDGTREFAERRDDWAVHVGLAVDGMPTAGAVALPAFGRCHDSLEPPALHDEARPLRLLVSRTRPPVIALRAAPLLGATLMPMGSAGAKVMAVMNGEAELYLHAGGQSEWDSCAPFAVALAAGLHCSRLDGSPVTYNHAQPLVPDLIVCHRSRAAGALALLASLG